MAVTESMSTTRSEALWERARKVIPGGVNSPVRAFKSVSGTPRFIKRGEGPWLKDADGNRWSANVVQIERTGSSKWRIRHMHGPQPFRSNDLASRVRQVLDGSEPG